MSLFECIQESAQSHLIGCQQIFLAKLWTLLSREEQEENENEEKGKKRRQVGRRGKGEGRIENEGEGMKILLIFATHSCPYILVFKNF